MKLFVDKMPESCGECPCHNFDCKFGYYFCNLLDEDLNDIEEIGRGRLRDCPLQSLADHDAKIYAKCFEASPSFREFKEYCAERWNKGLQGGVK